MTKLTNILAISTATSLFTALLAPQAFSQAYVNQALPAGPANPAYLTQVPPGSRAVTPRAPVKRLANRKPSKSPAALTAAAKPPELAHAYPSVGSGSTAIVRPTSADWPTVGRGTVAR